MHWVPGGQLSVRSECAETRLGYRDVPRVRRAGWGDGVEGFSWVLAVVGSAPDDRVVVRSCWGAVAGSIAGNVR